METYDIHPICACVPAMQQAQYALLREDIVNCGRIRESLVLRDGKILDGWHRYKVHQETGVPFTTREFDPATDGDPVEFVNSRTITRSMTPSQRAMMSIRLQAFADERRAAEDRMREGGRRGGVNKGIAVRRYPSTDVGIGRTSEKLAKKTGASSRMIDRANKVLAKGHPEMVKAVDSGTMTLTEAEGYLDLPKSSQARIAAEPDRKKRYKRKADTATRQRGQAHVGIREVARPTFTDVFIGQLNQAVIRLAFDCDLRTADEIVAAFDRLDLESGDIPHRLHALEPLIDAIVQIAARVHQPSLHVVQ